MPIVAPAFAEGPWRFINRQYFIIIYESDMDAIRALVPWPLVPESNRVMFDVMSMPDSSGLGKYLESGIVIPCTLFGKPVNYVHWMFLNDLPAIALGREVWGFPKKYGNPTLHVIAETLEGRLEYNGREVAVGTMDFKHQDLIGDDEDHEHAKAIAKKMCKTQICFKNIPGPDGKPAIKQLVGFELEKVRIKWAYQGDARLDLRAHVHAPLADLPVRKVIYGNHYLADLTLPYGRVEYDYLTAPYTEPEKSLG
jgi:acetoacetate decarboxylase